MAGVKKKKKDRIIMLKSTAFNQYGNPTGTFFVKRSQVLKPNVNKGKLEKLNLMKFDPKAFDKETGKIGFHVSFKETKMPPHSK
jgi:large subunit ribosomal protein L33